MKGRQSFKYHIYESSGSQHDCFSPNICKLCLEESRRIENAKLDPRPGTNQQFLTSMDLSCRLKTDGQGIKHGLVVIYPKQQVQGNNKITKKTRLFHVFLCFSLFFCSFSSHRPLWAKSPVLAVSSRASASVASASSRAGSKNRRIGGPCDVWLAVQEQFGPSVTVVPFDENFWGFFAKPRASYDFWGIGTVFAVRGYGTCLLWAEFLIGCLFLRGHLLRGVFLVIGGGRLGVTHSHVSRSFPVLSLGSCLLAKHETPLQPNCMHKIQHWIPCFQASIKKAWCFRHL